MNGKKLFISSVLVLIFFQLLTSFIESIYSLCLLQQQITEHLFGLLFFLSPLFFFILPKKNDSFYLKFFTVLIILSRVIMGFLDPVGKLIVSGFGTGIFLLLSPWLYKWLNHGKKGATNTIVSLSLAIIVLVLFKNIGSSLDITLNSYLGFIFLIPLFFIRKTFSFSGSNSSIKNTTDVKKETPISALFGIASIIILLYFAFASPVVFSRWSNMNYLWVLALFLSALVFTTYIFISQKKLLLNFIKKHIISLNVIFTVALVVTIAIQHINSSIGLPVEGIAMLWYHYIPQIITLLLWPILLIDFGVFATGFKNLDFSYKKIGMGLFVSTSLLIVIHILAHIFTSTWGYVPPVSTVFKDLFWLVHISPCIILIIALFVYLRKNNISQETYPYKGKRLYITTFLVFAFLNIGITYFVTANPTQLDDEVPKRLKIMTFNIQQGTNLYGNKAYNEQIALIKNYNPDVIGLQECDPLRISGGNLDIVRYFADKLNYYSYYGASPVTGTYGVALLCRYPITSSKTHFLTSEYEQVAMTESQVKVASQYYTITVNHPAGTHKYKLKQVQELLNLTKEKSNVIHIGDFNLRPDSEYYNLITETYTDTWSNGIEDVEAKERCSPIDHIFVSNSINILKSSCINTTVSDHNVVCVEVALD